MSIPRYPIFEFQDSVSAREPIRYAVCITFHDVKTQAAIDQNHILSDFRT